MSQVLQLYTYFRSSAAYRVRIALNLKGLPHELVPVHLLRDGGQQHAADYVRLNPQHLLPTLRHGERVIVQSLPILEYLDEVFGEVPLLPADAQGRARVRALAQAVACEIHPLNNLRVMQYLERDWDIDAARREAWMRHWMDEGFAALETLLADSPETGRFCHGDTPGMADCCLVPQLFNAHRFGVDLAPYPTLARIEQACLALDAFDRARPERQPDAQ
ncbi:MAG TPA: maleylacetoacetate isomerase [Stenotrophomonas sp.]|nr:maleylacetoacetate isomerase [Stenotrophomonas sp.]